VKEITAYTEDPDSTFPTPIIVAVSHDSQYRLQDNVFEFSEDQIIGEIIDGQHRIAGLKASTKIGDFTLPVIFMFDLVEEEKAYVFSIINSKQTPVSKSLIYDLFGLTESRSPQKTCHEVARLMNSDTNSPFWKRLKMLGRKEHEDASLSQGSFIKYLMPLISKHPDDDLIQIKRKERIEDDPSLPLRYYFVKKEDESIYKILLNVFTAVQATFPQEWSQPNEYILSKTVGYGAIMGALPSILKEGSKAHNLSRDFFEKWMQGFRERLASNRLRLTSDDFPSNEHEKKKLSNLIAGTEGEGGSR
jgi:DGQHR domain-containing protein